MQNTAALTAALLTPKWVTQCVQAVISTKRDRLASLVAIAIHMRASTALISAKLTTAPMIYVLHATKTPQPRMTTSALLASLTQRSLTGPWVFASAKKASI